MTDDRGLDHSETIDQNTEVEISNEFILLAQADTTAAQTSEPSGPAVAANSEIAPDSDNKVVLDALVSIENIQVDGSDLILIQPDGSQVRIVNGALNVPTFIIGEIEVPQDVLVAALNTNGFNVAAGPGNTLSVTPQAPTGSGGDFQNSGASIAGDGL
ncbi:MAG: hypothetical protein U1A06_00215, partial [Hoeflea sp.]|nr:hypothetical protein [Hoeflea sp.]